MKDCLALACSMASSILLSVMGRHGPNIVPALVVPFAGPRHRPLQTLSCIASCFRSPLPNPVSRIR